MNKIPLSNPVLDKDKPCETGEKRAPLSKDIFAPPAPELLRSFVYREPAGVPSQDEDPHPHRRRSDRVPHK